MTLAYIIYTLLLVFLIISTWIYNKIDSKNKNGFLFVTIIICSLVLGFRYDVGVDFLNYEYIYNHQYFEDVEDGYALINKVLFSLGFSSSSIFILIAFLQLFFFIKGVENINSRYLPFAIFFYFSTLYIFLSLNVLRQALTFSIFLFSIKYIVNRQFIKYAVTILLASSIHRSALTLLPFYFFINFDWLLHHHIIQLLGYFTTFAISLTLSEYIWSNFETIATISGYDEYGEKINTLSEIQWEKQGGLGVYMWMIIDLWVIIYFPKISKLIITKYDIIVYNLYYIGLLLTNIVSGSYFERANLYFQHFRIVVYAIFFYKIFSNSNKILQKHIALGIILVLILFFYMGIFNKASMCAPYQFVSF